MRHNLLELDLTTFKKVVKSGDFYISVNSNMFCRSLYKMKSHNIIYAISLNDAYSKTRQFYFPNQGTAGANVYLVMESRPYYTLERLREDLMGSLINV